MTSENQKEALAFLWTQNEQLLKNYFEDIANINIKSTVKRTEAVKTLSKKLYELQKDFYKRYIKE